MEKWTERSGKIVANRAWITTEAWAIMKRCKASGINRTFGESMNLAWFSANMEVSVQNKVRSKIAETKQLATVGADRLIEMRNQIENIDRQSREDKERLSKIRQAMLYV